MADQTVGLGEIVGNEAHDDVDSGNPVKTGGRARTAVITPVANDDRVDQIMSPTGAAMVAGADPSTNAPSDLIRHGLGGLYVTGDVAHDSADATSNPMKMGGRARTSVIAAVANNDRVDQVMTTSGAAVIGASDASTQAPVSVFGLATGGLLVTGDVSHDAADTGRPVKIGGRALTTEPTLVAVNDRVNAWYDQAGRQTVRMAADSGAPDGQDPLKKIDIASGAADGGLSVFGIRRDADTSPVDASGDYHGNVYDASGYLKVNVKAGAAGGVTHTDDAAFTATTDDGVPVFGFHDDTSPPGVTDGNAGAVRMTGTRSLHMVIRDGAENERALNISAENAAAVAGDVASSATDAGYPIKIGGIFNGDPGPVSEGERVNAQFNAYGAQRVTFYGAERVQGSIAHDSAGTGVNPVLEGFLAINHGTDPAEVAANDIHRVTCDRQGMPFGMLGHPAVIVREYMTTAVQTNDAIIDTIGANQRVVILLIDATLEAGNTVDTKVRIGFGTASVPAEPASGASVTGMVLSHPSLAAGSGMVKGDGGARVAVGGLGEELRITNTVPTNGQLTVTVHYYIIDEA